MRLVFTILSLVSVILFPWPFTVILAFSTSLMEPLVPLAVGIFADTIYYNQHANILPLFTIYGAAMTAIAFFVRSRLRTGIIKK